MPASMIAAAGIQAGPRPAAPPSESQAPSDSENQPWRRHFLTENGRQGHTRALITRFADPSLFPVFGLSLRTLWPPGPEC
jgi:hypothetical protein